ncbi:MAG: superoxide dismutase family protein [Pseudonocardiales bacterium]
MIVTLSEELPPESQLGRSGQLVRRPLARSLALAALGVAVALAPIACSAQQSTSVPEPTTTATNEPTVAADLGGEGRLTAPGQPSNAFTYDPALAPVGAVLRVALTASNGSTTATRTTTATLEVSGLLPNRGYAVHLHDKACGSTGAAAGPHFQHQVDPAATPDMPSTDPTFANPRNEIWLDIRTDATGSGTSTTEVPFAFTDRAPASVVVHEQMVTATEPGKAGMAGARIACFTLPNE